MYDFICFWIISHVTLANKEERIGPRKSKGGLIKWATIDKSRGLLVNHNLRRVGLSFFFLGRKRTALH